MQLILASQRKKMLANGACRNSDPDRFDPLPVVKLFMIPASTWLLASLDPRDEDVAFGLCDLGVGSPRLETVLLSDLARLGAYSFRGCGMERDKFFVPRFTLREYAEAAAKAGYVRT